jgi:hypothetical protein
MGEEFEVANTDYNLKILSGSEGRSDSPSLVEIPKEHKTDL